MAAFPVMWDFLSGDSLEILSRESFNLGDDPLYLEIGRNATRPLVIFFYPSG